MDRDRRPERGQRAELDGVNRAERDTDVEALIDAAMWEPHYRNYVVA